MKVLCQHCGQLTNTNVTGRKPLNYSVKNVCDALLSCCSVSLAAQKLGCSRGYIYQVLKQRGTTPKEVLAK